MKQLSRMILAVSLMLVSFANQAEPIHLIANTFPPYADKQLPGEGMALEIVTHVYKKAGYEPKVSIETWPRVMEGVQVGLFDAVAHIWYSEEREKNFRYSRPYLVNTMKIVKLKSLQGDYLELSHLQDKRIGVIRDYAYGVDFSTVPGLTQVTENRLILNLLNLLNGKVDFVIGDERAIAMQLSQYLNREQDKFEMLDIDLPGRSAYVGVSRDNPKGEKHIADFNKALVQSLEDGSYKAIVDKWHQRYGLALQPFPGTGPSVSQ